jgi:DNA integrity scanning protein DisA with diadenylate cyclase activity
MLVSAGYKTIQSIIEADDETLRGISGVEESDVEQIRAAAESFLKSGAAASVESLR